MLAQAFLRGGMRPRTFWRLPAAERALIAGIVWWAEEQDAARERAWAEAFARPR